jgi:phosphatidylserine/phosphatidylglycerophosphate/cardiolipin synthase-like enzyme
MRKSKTTGSLTVRAIAGTYVVVLAFDMSKNDSKELLGFSIHRRDHTSDEAYYMSGMKTFSETDPGFPSGSLYPTNQHPWQSFQWADYSAKPGFRYTYTITALKGEPRNLIPYAQTKINITTESVVGRKHTVYFNRGTAASQEYVRRFGDKRPEEVPNNKAFEWLSRGIYEALELLINSCQPGVHALRIAAYEFHYEKLLLLIKQAVDRNVDIKIVYDCRKDKGPKKKNRDAVDAVGLKDYCIERTEGASYISHNKFIVKLENNIPISVWTGGMNFSINGIFGHSNVAHVIADKKIARIFFNYWQQLADNLKTPDMKNQVEILTPLPPPSLPKDDTCVFSPRKNLDALNLYHDLALAAVDGVFMTFAFGINNIFKDVYENSTCTIRFALLEKMTRPLAADSPERIEEEEAIQRLRNKPENVFAIGDFIQTNKLDGWVKEKLTGLSTNVKYIHNKFLLLDPLGDDPIVITGSANFSEASTDKNDENMVIIKGNKRVADIYFGEFMRLFTHHTFRESLKWRNPNDPPKPLKTNASPVKWWVDYFKQSPRFNLKAYFSQLKL